MPQCMCFRGTRQKTSDSHQRGHRSSPAYFGALCSKRLMQMWVMRHLTPGVCKHGVQLGDC